MTDTTSPNFDPAADGIRAAREDYRLAERYNDARAHGWNHSQALRWMDYARTEREREARERATVTADLRDADARSTEGAS